VHTEHIAGLLARPGSTFSRESMMTKHRPQIGGSTNQLIGKAFNLRSPSDLAGNYSAIGAGGALAGGAGGVQLQNNANGVVLHLSGIKMGVELGRRKRCSNRHGMTQRSRGGARFRRGLNISSARNVRRSGKGDDPEHARTYLFDDRLDRATLARGGPASKHDDHPEPIFPPSWRWHG
jgi:hypothetical protein